MRTAWKERCESAKANRKVNEKMQSKFREHGGGEGRERKGDTQHAYAVEMPKLTQHNAPKLEGAQPERPPTKWLGPHKKNSHKESLSLRTSFYAFRMTLHQTTHFF